MEQALWALVCIVGVGIWLISSAIDDLRKAVQALHNDYGKLNFHPDGTPKR